MKENPINKINLTEQSDRDLFVPVYLNFLHSNKLTGKEKLIYICLKSFLAVGSDNGQVFPSIETICEMTDMSKSTVIRHLKSMEKKDVLKIKRQGLTKPNLYTLYDKRSLWEENATDEAEEQLSEIEKAKKLLEAAGYSVSKEEKATVDPETLKECKEETLEESIKGQIEYDKLIEENSKDKELVDTIVDVMVEAMQHGVDVTSTNNNIKGESYHVRLTKIDKDMVKSVMQKFKEAKKVINPKKYLLSMLYNQPTVQYVESITQTAAKKQEGKTNTFHNFEQREYDYDELEKRLRDIRSQKD